MYMYKVKVRKCVCVCVNFNVCVCVQQNLMTPNGIGLTSEDGMYIYQEIANILQIVQIVYVTCAAHKFFWRITFSSNRNTPKLSDMTRTFPSIWCIYDNV